MLFGVILNQLKESKKILQTQGSHCFPKSYSSPQIHQAATHPSTSQLMPCSSIGQPIWLSHVASQKGTSKAPRRCTSKQNLSSIGIGNTYVGAWSILKLRSTNKLLASCSKTSKGRQQFAHVCSVQGPLYNIPLPTMPGGGGRGSTSGGTIVQPLAHGSGSAKRYSIKCSTVVE